MKENEKPKGTKKKEKTNGGGFYAISKEGIVEAIQVQLVTREMLISTLFGLTVVLGMRLLPSTAYMLGLVATVFFVYYILGIRKGKLRDLGSGVYMYYTQELNRQVIRVQHYSQSGIRRELYTFGVVNIILLEVLGILLMNNGNFGEMTFRLGVTAVGILLYITVFNATVKRYSKRLRKEILYAVDNLNQGIQVTSTPEEKVQLKDYYGVTNEELSGLNVTETSDEDDEGEGFNTLTETFKYDTEQEVTPLAIKTTHNKEDVEGGSIEGDKGMYGKYTEDSELVNNDAWENEPENQEEPYCTVTEPEEPYMTVVKPEEPIIQDYVPEEPIIQEVTSVKDKSDEPIVTKSVKEEPYVMVSGSKVAKAKVKEREEKDEEFDGVESDEVVYETSVDTPDEDDDDILGVLEVISDVNESKITHSI